MKWIMVLVHLTAPHGIAYDAVYTDAMYVSQSQCSADVRHVQDATGPQTRAGLAFCFAIDPSQSFVAPFGAALQAEIDKSAIAAQALAKKLEERLRQIEDPTKPAPPPYSQAQFEALLRSLRQ